MRWIGSTRRPSHGEVKTEPPIAARPLEASHDQAPEPTALRPWETSP